MKPQQRISPYVFPGMPGAINMTGDAELKTIMIACASVLNMTEEDLIGRCRKRECVVFRHIFCFLARQYSNKSLQSIGHYILRDHSSVIHAVQTMNDQLENDEQLLQKIITCEKELKRLLIIQTQTT